MLTLTVCLLRVGCVGGISNCCRPFVARRPGRLFGFVYCTGDIAEVLKFPLFDTRIQVKI